MVMAKPIEFTIVRAVPLDAAGALFATNVENRGESATTVRPQKIRNATSKMFEPARKISGDSKQQKPERKRAVPAVLLVPRRSEI